jgi:hypothetical protein
VVHKFIEDQHGDTICGLWGDCYQQDQQANARLIVAAPDLLAFAIRVVEGEGDSIRTLIEQGRAAIKKATEE